MADGVGERQAGGGSRGGRPAVADGRGPHRRVGSGEGDGAVVGGKLGRVGQPACGGLFLQGAGQGQMQGGVGVSGEPGRQHLAEQVMSEPEPVLGADQHPRGSGQLQMGLDIDGQGLLQEAGAQRLSVERGGCQRVHAVLREPGQAPLDNVTDRVRTRHGQPARVRHATDARQARQFGDEKRVARGAVPHPPGFVVTRLPAQVPGHQLGDLGRAEPAQGI